jgi:predicted  nucleic acid-binding Zn-ribbon protein
MSERDHSNRLIGGIVILAAVFFGSVGLVWSSGAPLPSKALADVPPKPKAAVVSADQVAGLDKRMVALEAKVKDPPTFDASQIEAQIKGLESQLASIHSQLGTFKAADFDALKTKIDSSGTNPKSAKATIDTLQADVGNLRARFDQLSQQVASAATTSDTKPSSHKSHSKSK